MATSKDPIRQLLDIAVFAPVGLILLAQKELPNLASTGRTRIENQITLTKFIGKVAVQKGRSELQRRLDAVQAARNSARSSSTNDSSVVESTAVEWTDPLSTSGDPLDVAVSGDPFGVGGPISLPEALISAVVAADRKAGKTSERKRAPRSADATKSVVTAPAADLPIEGYDSLAASQVVVRLATLTPDELATILRHEQTHRARRTILGKISQLQAR